MVVRLLGVREVTRSDSGEDDVDAGEELGAVVVLAYCVGDRVGEQVGVVQGEPVGERGEVGLAVSGARLGSRSGDVLGGGQALRHC